MKGWNFLSFLGGLLVGAIYLGLYLLVLRFQDFDFATLGDQWYSFGWISTFAVMLGVSAGCRDGFGILNFILFVAGALALQFFGVYSLVVGVNDIKTYASSSNLFAYLAIGGFMTLYWYFFIGIGKGNFIFSAVIPLVLALVAGWLLTAKLDNYTSIMWISIAVDVVSMGLVVLLRVLNGSALDH